ncbi:hypothetical protein L3X40_11585 [Rhizorhapis sp. SPR117]|uniref:hypothetical protein n=1 Tax=Rhizorhapis sp. SPR117 TaxID=2912611 RepID=UPI001F1A0831|nr:hypothetical protein [Rhizorhapis sp. SPR117]
MLAGPGDRDTVEQLEEIEIQGVQDRRCRPFLRRQFDDEHFWSLVNAAQLSIHIIDTIKVQWAFHGKADNPKAIRVLRVLEFNDEVLSAPLDDNALSAILGRYTKTSDGQGSLFGD